MIDNVQFMILFLLKVTKPYEDENDNYGSQGFSKVGRWD